METRHGDQALTPALSLSTGRGGNALARFLAVSIPPLILLGALAAGCYFVAGTGLMLYVGGLSLAMLLTSPLVLAHRERVERLLAAASMVDGVGVVWLVAMFASETTFGQWLAAYVLLAACVIGVAGVAAGLSRIMGELFAAAITTVTAIAWLAWPIWLSAWVEHAGVVRAMQWLIPVHPLLALNGLLSHLGVWGESPLMYQVTSLGQDVPYGLPSSVTMSAGFHALLGGALLLVPAAGELRPPVDEPD